MKATVHNVPTITIMLNKDEALALGRVLKTWDDQHMMPTFETKLFASILDNIRLGLEVSI
jgi:hypothetical protein